MQFTLIMGRAFAFPRHCTACLPRHDHDAEMADAVFTSDKKTTI